MNEEIGSLADAAAQRRERLKALKNAAKNTDAPDEPPRKKSATGTNSLPRPIFRSYKPHDEKLKESIKETSLPVEVADNVKEMLAQAAPEPIVDEVELINLAPRKPDWDLKRDVSKKLEKLERRTMLAIAELIRERLRDSGEQPDLAKIASVDSSAVQTAADDD